VGGKKNGTEIEVFICNDLKINFTEKGSDFKRDNW
jgi:hypothetical protein